MVEKRTEQLITRRLDGCLGDGESLELDKRLIRSLEARRIFEDSQRIDALATQTLRALFGQASHGELEDSLRLPPQNGALPGAIGRRNRHRFWNAGIGAAAAMLLFMVSSSLMPLFGPNAPPVAPGLTAESAGSIGPSVQWGLPTAGVGNPAGLTPVVAGPRHHRERIDQDVIAVVDPETQSVYVLELETAQNTISPVRARY